MIEIKKSNMQKLKVYPVYDDEYDEYGEINEINKYAIDDYVRMYEEMELQQFQKKHDKSSDTLNASELSGLSGLLEENEKMTAGYISSKYTMRKYQSFSFILIICVITAGLLISKYQIYQKYIQNLLAALPYSDITPLRRDYKTPTEIPKAVYDKNMDIYVKAAEESAITNIVRTNVLNASNVSDETLLKYTQKHRIKYINQIEEKMPNGCEIVSLTMVLSRYIPEISAREIYLKGYMPKKPLPSLQTGVYIAEDPTNYYIGNPDSAGYGIFAPGLAKTAINTLQAYNLGKTVIDISGCSENELFEYVSDGYPVIAWCTMRLQPVNWERYYWHLPNGRIYRYPGNQHCCVLVEYTDSTVTLYDPTNGIVEYGRALFLQRWDELGPYPDITRQAIVIK